jgi:hypothetical protein
VVDGKTPHSAKIFITPLRERVMYVVEIRKAGESEEQWKIAKQCTSSRGLILEKLERGVEILIRVSAINTKGQGRWSSPAAFMPR